MHCTVTQTLTYIPVQRISKGKTDIAVLQVTCTVYVQCVVDAASQTVLGRPTIY